MKWVLDWAKFWNGSEAYLPETDVFVFCLYVGESCEAERAREISQSEAYLLETYFFVFCLNVGKSCKVERAKEQLEIYIKN